MKIQTTNPATGHKLQSYKCLTSTEIKKNIELGHSDYLLWRKTTFAQRASLMLELAQLLTKQKNDLAVLMAIEMGKPITAGQAEIDKCVWVCEHYAQHAEEYLSPRTIITDMKSAKVCYTPRGIVFAIMPWNFPFWQIFRFAAPTIMAGNAAILKHAAISTGTGNKIAALFKEAGFPNNLFQNFIVDNDAAASVLDYSEVIAVTLTGSGRAGRSIASKAGSCLKKSVLELGGCDPYLVLADANIELAATCIVNSRLNNAGQVCIAAKRILVMQSVEKELVTKIMEKMPAFKMGDPLDPKTTLGPLARQDLREILNKQVQKSIKQGAKLLLGGIIPQGEGFFYPPTLLTEVKPGMPAFDEELFGPVIAVTSVATEAELISLANQSEYGLGAAVFTKDLVRGEYLATHEIEAGVCFVNALVASDPRIPFGGIKNSGYGRELSKEGILEFVNTKTIAISDA